MPEFEEAYQSINRLKRFNAGERRIPALCWGYEIILTAHQKDSHNIIALVHHAEDQYAPEQWLVMRWGGAARSLV